VPSHISQVGGGRSSGCSPRSRRCVTTPSGRSTQRVIDGVAQFDHVEIRGEQRGRGERSASCHVPRLETGGAPALLRTVWHVSPGGARRRRVVRRSARRGQQIREVAAPGLTVMASSSLWQDLRGASEPCGQSGLRHASRFPMAPRPRIRCDPTPGCHSRVPVPSGGPRHVGGLVPPSRSGNQRMAGATDRGPLTLGLVSTILEPLRVPECGAALSARGRLYRPGRPLASPISAASTNPARSFGPELLA